MVNSASLPIGHGDDAHRQFGVHAGFDVGMRAHEAGGLVWGYVAVV